MDMDMDECNSGSIDALMERNSRSFTIDFDFGFFFCGLVRSPSSLSHSLLVIVIITHWRQLLLGACVTDSIHFAQPAPFS